MALTGIVLMGFVFAHMIGNLKMYLGPAEFDHYSEFLRELLVPILPRTVFLWLIRIGLIAAFALPHPRRVRADDDQPQGPARATSHRATTSPSTSRPARCAGPASSSSSS